MATSPLQQKANEVVGMCGMDFSISGRFGFLQTRTVRFGIRFGSESLKNSVFGSVFT
jgi:hypothetical protein